MEDDSLCLLTAVARLEHVCVPVFLNRNAGTAMSTVMHMSAVQCEEEDQNGRTPLHYACYYSSSEVIAEMCRLRTNVNHTDKKRRTPLHVVVCRAHSGAPLVSRSCVGIPARELDRAVSRVGLMPWLQGLQMACYSCYQEPCH